MTSYFAGTGPITPAQLLIALHHIEGKGEDMKGVIAATNLCFAEKGIYTSEVLAIVLTQLLEVEIYFIHFLLNFLPLGN